MTDLDLFIATFKSVGLHYRCQASRDGARELARLVFFASGELVVLKFTDGKFDG